MQPTLATLQGPTINLVPLEPGHQASLCAIGLDERLWQRTTIQVRTAEEMHEYMQTALDAQSAGTGLPFVIQKRDSRQIIGCTRFHSFNALHRRIEIGFTWLPVPWQGTGANVEAKFLMLRHAFESLQCVRVQFTADVENAPSRRVLERIGATYEGLLRNYMVSARSGPRDIVIYSIIASEWPDLAVQLKSRVGM